MAQAARLNLRIQKELKLLLADPPPGASFPSLSADAASSSSSSTSGLSLSSIDAQIEGPEGTVYAKGFFKLKIQIPDRYPFQPPIVTFATPIYHPNIDNGGRICLDILNLPPKGAWQPSLNISTVLTSIGLLLGEPNPDDGLMREASQEYKYNRQAFDLKARSMTEKYARTGLHEIASVGQGCQTLPKPSMGLAEAKGSDTSMREVSRYLVGNKRLCGISRKLSLESPVFDPERNDGKRVNETPSLRLYETQTQLEGLKQESNGMPSVQVHTLGDPQRLRKKLSLEHLGSFLVKEDSEMIDTVSSECKSTLRMESSKSLALDKAVSVCLQEPYQDGDERSKYKTIDTKLEKEELLETLVSSRGTLDDPEKLLAVDQDSAKSFSLPQTIRQNGIELHSVVDGDGNGFTGRKHKKLAFSSRQFSSSTLASDQCQGSDDSENLAPSSSFLPANSSNNPTTLETGPFEDRSTLNYTQTCLSHNSCRTQHRQPLKPLSQFCNGNNGNFQSEMQSFNPSKISDPQPDNSYNEKKKVKQDCTEKFAVGIKKQEEMSPSFDANSAIVLDSEDSDEDQGRAPRSKLSLVRRRLKGKSRS